MYPAAPMKSIIVALEPLPDVITLLTVWKRDFYSISQKSPVMRVCTLCVSLIVHGDLDGTHVFKTRLNELGSQETFYTPLLLQAGGLSIPFIFLLIMSSQPFYISIGTNSHIMMLS